MALPNTKPVSHSRIIHPHKNTQTYPGLQYVNQILQKICTYYVRYIRLQKTGNSNKIYFCNFQENCYTYGGRQLKAKWSAASCVQTIIRNVLIVKGNTFILGFYTLWQQLCWNSRWKVEGLGQTKRNLGNSHLLTQYTLHMPTGFASSTLFSHDRASLFSN